MKKKITLLFALAVVMTTGIFANPNVNSKVINTFTSHFQGAREVVWKQTEHYLKAEFFKDDQAMSAYFSESGKLLGVARNIRSQQLPIKLNTDVKQLMTNNWITELFEYTDGQETAYYVTIENANQKIYYKSSGSEGWNVFKKVKKN